MDRVVSGSQPRLIWLTGSKGYGKSTLLRGAAIAARSLGWTALSVSCAQVDRGNAETLLHAIAARARRALDRQSRGTEPSAPLEAPADVPAELVVARLLEEIAVDRPLLLTIDEAQFFNIQHAKAIRYVYTYLVELPFCLLLAGGTEVPPLSDLPTHHLELTLGPLDPADALALVAAEYPDAPEDVANAIVAQAHGSPAEIASVAAFARLNHDVSAALVSSTARGRVRRGILALPSELREFLQCCSLLEGPIDERLSVTLAGSLPNLIEFMAAGANTYLVKRSAELEFTHPVLMEGTRESIELDFPIRRKVLDALLRLKRREDAARIIQHAAALQDFETCYATAAWAADDAHCRNLWGLCAELCARALEFGWPAEDGYVSFFRNYASALRKLGKHEGAAGIVTDALRLARERGYRSGLGQLAATLISIYVEMEDADGANRTYTVFSSGLERPEEVADLHAAIGTLHANLVDEVRFLEVTAPLRDETFPPNASPLAFAVYLHSQTILDARLGRHDSARRALNGVSSRSLAIRSIFDYYLPLTELFIDFQHIGCKALRDDEPSGPFAEITNTAYWHYIHLVADFVSGNWRAVDSRLGRLNLERFNPFEQALLIAVPVAIGALTERPSQFEELAASLSTRARRRSPGPSIAQLGIWFLLGRTEAVGPALRELTAAILGARTDRVGADALCLPPVALALYAAKHEPQILRELAAPVTEESSRWLGAQQLFACGYAQHTLGIAGGRSLISRARNEFAAMGADFLAAFAAASAGTASEAERGMLSGHGVHWFEGPQVALERAECVGARSGLTARERQVAELVAEGMRNREIAQALFLSERTVEVHLGSIFGKLDIRSRGQLTRQMIESRKTRSG